MSETQSLKQITVKIGSGATPRGGETVYKDKGISFIRSQNVLDFTFTNNNMAHIDEAQAESLATVDVHEDDILLNITGDSIARACIVPNNVLPARVNQHVAIIRCKPNIEARYVFYYLEYLKPYLLNICGIGGTRNALTKEILESLQIVTQTNPKEIAAVLSSLDNKIELNSKICSELESLAKDLYHYWFSQFDFPYEKGRPYRSSGGKMVWNKELGREIPERWEVHKLIDIVPIVLGGTPDTSICSYWDNGNINWLSSGEIASFPVLSADTKISQEAIDNSATVLLRTGSVALSITRYIRPTILGIDACINQSVVGIEESAIYKHSFLYPFIESQVSKYMGLRTGAMQPHINKTTVEDTPIICPPDRVLHEYYKTADPLFAQIMTIARESFELARLRDFLLPLLMNGQVSVCE